MKKFDAVELMSDNNALNKNGIKKGFIGILICPRESAEDCIVMFFNPKNEGDYAVAVVQKCQLKVLGAIPNEAVKDIQEITGQPSFFKHTSLNVSTVKEYDKIELIIDKPEYSKAGVYKGMQGCVMSDHAIKNKWQVIFSEEGTGKDIADINILEKDFIVLD